jgi:hypothetical protein
MILPFPQHVTLIAPTQPWHLALAQAIVAAGWEVAHVASFAEVPPATDLIIFDDIDDDPVRHLQAHLVAASLSQAPMLVVVPDISRPLAASVLAAGAVDVAQRFMLLPVLIARCRILLKLPRADGGLESGLLTNALLRVND